MLYSREVLGLMRPFPGRRFKMAQLVGYVLRSGREDAKAKDAARKAVRRVLERLHGEGFIGIEVAATRGSGARYFWNVTANCEANTGRDVSAECARELAL